MHTETGPRSPNNRSPRDSTTRYRYSERATDGSPMTKYTRRIVYPSGKVEVIKNLDSREASPISGYRLNPITNRTKFDLSSQRNLLMSQTKLG